MIVALPGLFSYPFLQVEHNDNRRFFRGSNSFFSKGAYNTGKQTESYNHFLCFIRSPLSATEHVDKLIYYLRPPGTLVNPLAHPPGG